MYIYNICIYTYTYIYIYIQKMLKISGNTWKILIFSIRIQSLFDIWPLHRDGLERQMERGGGGERHVPVRRRHVPELLHGHGVRHHNHVQLGIKGTFASQSDAGVWRTCSRRAAAPALDDRRPARSTRPTRPARPPPRLRPPPPPPPPRTPSTTQTAP